MQATEAIGRILSNYFKPRERLGPAEWSERHIRLSHKSSSIPGFYRLDETPALRRIYEDIGNPRVRKVVLPKAAQFGCSQLASNVFLYYVCNHNLPIGAFFPSDDLAQKFSEQKFRPSLDACRPAREQLTGNPDDLRKNSYLFNSCSALFLGAGTPSKLASNSFGVLLIDEVDKLNDYEAFGEADAVSLAEKRTIAYPDDSKTILLSTPTSEGSSQIWSEYLKGSQSKLHCPCPQCGHRQELVLNQIIFSHCKQEDGRYDLDRVKRETFYECIECKGRINEQQRREMIRCGIWVDTNPNPFPAEFRSYHLSGLISLWHTLGGIAVAYLLSKDDVSQLHDFWNSILGVPWEDRAATIKENDIDELVRESPRFYKGQLAQRPDILLAGFDVQKDHFWFSVIAVNRDDSVSIVDWGKIISWSDVEAVLGREYALLGTDQKFRISKAVCDSKHKPYEVYDACLKTSFRLVPIAGHEGGESLSKINDQSVSYRGIRIPALKVEKHWSQTDLYLNTIKLKYQRLFLPVDTDDDLRKHLSSTQLVEKRNKRGLTETYWKSSRQNHIGDCIRYAKALRMRLIEYILGLRNAPAPVAEEPNPEENTDIGDGYQANPWN